MREIFARLNTKHALPHNNYIFQFNSKMIYKIAIFPY